LRRWLNLSFFPQAKINPEPSRIMHPPFLATSLLALAGLAVEAAALGQTSVERPFSIQQQEGAAWLVRPDGTRFFSLGVCVVNQGASRADFSLTNPGYAAFKHYESSNHWAEATLKRLKSWGFTTIGGWSDYLALQRCRGADVAFTPVLAVGMTCGVPWWDMWDTNIISRMHKVARDQILPLRDEPRLLGYYTDNEMGWWNAALLKMTLEQAPTSGQRRRLMDLLRQTYGNNWSALLKDFEAEGAGSFQALDQGGMLYLRPGSGGIRTYRRFLGLMAERYYSLVREIVRTYDPRGLILGDRYQSFYYPEVAKASAPYVDAASGNFNASWNDGTFVRYYLGTLHELTGKPVLVSEFYMAARDNRSGNKNDNGLFPVVGTQKERAAGFRNTVEALLRIPYVIGADWFQYYDEPTHGRGDGENFNFGLVDIYDRPYERLTGAAAALDLVALKSRRGQAPLDASHDVPPAPRDPLGHFEPNLALQHWDRERGFVKPVSEFPLADLYICWDKKAIYLGLYAQDVVEDAFYRNKTVPEGDRAEWIIVVGEQNKPIRVRIGAGAAPACSEPTLRIASHSGVNLRTRNIAAMALPARLFAKDRFKAGDTIQFTCNFFTHCRAYRVEWKGTFSLRAWR
jgi:hypothetical protein